jgi:hypothetical protein
MILFAMAGMAIFLYRGDLYSGHVSFMTMTSVGIPGFATVFDQQ